MKNNKLIAALAITATLLASCSTNDTDTTETTNQATTTQTEVNGTTQKITSATVLSAPVAEAKIYKLLPGYDSSDVFEGSGVQYLNGYFYVACDNTQKIAKIKSTLPINSSSNSLLSTGAPGSGSSNYEGITYEANGTPHFYVVEETVKNGSVYQPRISKLDDSMTYQSRDWADYSFSSANSNKGFEGLAWVSRDGNNYLLGLVEGTGKIAVLLKGTSSWNLVTEITLPSSVTFTDYSDLAISASGKVAITSQEDGQLWVGQLSSTSWSITGGTAYTFPLGSSSGVIGAGTLQLYGNVEGVSFITDTQIVICSDKAGSDQPSYQSYKEQTVSVFNLP
ncbi:SdiA-regulated domain-containing protein [Flavobacterium sp. RHBU_3]|uniref:SdiA-regulated domain-containing protein n=1 Tax=Flavobacterium sp. RHBU_3 TaxID=3391184 RepID=UPI003984E31D